MHAHSAENIANVEASVTIMHITCAILQPHYLPWIGYFEMIDRVDVFVFLDDVQFIKREWKNRNRIRQTPTGNDTRWLTVPIVKEDQSGPIHLARIANHADWVENHLNSIRHAYGKSPVFCKYIDGLHEIFNQYQHGTLADLNINLIRWLMDEIGIHTPLKRSSELSSKGHKEQKLISLCQKVKATSYLANNATGEYTGLSDFAPHGIEFKLQNYDHPRYLQIHRSKELPFLSHLSVIDLLFNQGNESLSIIRKGHIQPPDFIKPKQVFQ